MSAAMELGEAEVFVSIGTHRDGRIRAQNLGEVLTPIRTTLADLDHVLERRVHRPEWDIRDLRQTGRRLSLVLSPDFGTRLPGTVAATAELLIEGVSRLHREPHLPPSFNADVVDRIHRLGTVKDIAEVRLEIANRKNAIVDDVTARNAAQATNVAQTTFGSVHGVLDTMTARTKFQCQIYDRAARRSVRVFAADHEMETGLRTLFGNHVEVWGELTRNASGQPLSLIARELREQTYGDVVLAVDLLGILQLPPGRSSIELLEEARRGL